jgi:hypothetical protein
VAQPARRARRLASFSLAWLCFEGAATTTAGLLAGSVALIGNGLDGAMEGLASMIIVWRFSGSRTLSTTSERQAQELVALSFFLHRLRSHPRPAHRTPRRDDLAGRRPLDRDPLRLPVARAREATTRGAARIRSDAGEGRQNLICAYLAAAVLAGLLANTLFGIWWLDPLVALSIAALAITEGRRAWRGEDCRCASCAAPTLK